ncbi:MAG: adenine nucleotide alpha hydrolase family protein [Clostridia bacterium]|nr:adenine nucleotide alpha hydrolase family protein [Clostridia bacterium]
MQMLMSRMRAAMEKYNMIEDGDTIAVGVSGGKDSLALLYALSEMRRFYPKKYEVKAITADMCFLGEKTDFSEITSLCNKLEVEHIIRETELYHIIFEVREEKNPCSLCARMRRGILHDMTKEAGCNKLALGHHMDDAAETFMMNLLSGGRIESFRPVTYLSRKDLYMIRPMIFASEKEVLSAARKTKLPTVESPCPMDKISNRNEMKQLIKELEKTYPALKEKIIGGLQKADLCGW